MLCGNELRSQLAYRLLAISSKIFEESVIAALALAVWYIDRASSVIALNSPKGAKPYAKRVESLCRWEHGMTKTCNAAQ